MQIICQRLCTYIDDIVQSMGIHLPPNSQEGWIHLMPLDGRVHQAPRGIRDLIYEEDQSIASINDVESRDALTTDTLTVR